MGSNHRAPEDGLGLATRRIAALPIFLEEGGGLEPLPTLAGTTVFETASAPLQSTFQKNADDLSRGKLLCWAACRSTVLGS
jgi:hypothetical protein